MAVLSLLVLVLGIVLLNVFVVDGSTLGDPRLLAFELSVEKMLASPEEWVDHWMWHQPPPFRYRILGRFPTWLSWELVDAEDPELSFHALYVFWAFFWMAATATAFYGLLKHLCRELDDRLASGPWMPWLGSVFLLSAPPMLFAFKYPVHTENNDLLAYFLITLGMIAILRNRSWMMCALACLAVFCRENTLIVPLAYLIAGRDRLPKRLVLAGIPVLTLGAFRVLWWEPYEPWHAAPHNFTRPWETTGFLILAFGALWLPGLLGYLELRRDPLTRATEWNKLAAAFPPVFLSVIATTFLLARVREIRILFVLSVFLVPFSIYWLARNRRNLGNRVRTGSFWAGVVSAAVVAVLGRWTLVPRGPIEDKFLATKLEFLYVGFGRGWLDILFVYLFALAVLLSVVLRYRKPEPLPPPERPDHIREP